MAFAPRFYGNASARIEIGWRQGQIPHSTHHDRSPHDGQVFTFMSMPSLL